MYFQDEIVQELKQLYVQLEQETEWDLSLQSLQQVMQQFIPFYSWPISLVIGHSLSLSLS